MRILVTGGMGYVGSRLVPQLLEDGHDVVVYDIGWFGDGGLAQLVEKAGKRLQLVVGDIRDLPRLDAALAEVEAVIHLACVSNDHSCQLDEALSTSINLDAFEPLVLAAKKAGVRRFIYASSSSVYGVSDAPEVREDHALVPLTLYNRYKGMCEPILFGHQAEAFECVTVRPATVCGPAPRMRFDLTVNIMTNLALRKGEITVFGGEQKRPNLHIQDMVDCYRLLLAAPAGQVAGETFNVGRQNLKVAEIAGLVHGVIRGRLHAQMRIVTTESTDNRSYHINSDKIRDRLGFEPKLSVEQAVEDICSAFAEGRWPDSLTNPIYTNVKQLVDKGFAVQDPLASYRQDRYAAAT